MSHQSPEIPLTLVFTPDEAGAAVRWEAAVLGVRQSRFAAPYRGEDLTLVLRALDALQTMESFAVADLRRLGELGLPTSDGMPEERAAQIVGRALYAALTADAEGSSALRTVRDVAAANGARLALRLHFPLGAVELAALPWELLWGDDPAPLLLSRGQLGSCTRHLDLAAALPPPRTAAAPLRILPVVAQAGSEPAWLAGDRAARLAAWQPLIAQGQVQMLPDVSPATRRALIDAVQDGPPPDILHFIGHGSYQDGTGALLLDAPDGGGDLAPIAQLLPLFGGVRLVVLTACQAAMVGGGAGAGILGGVAPALSAAGVPLVIAMQFAVRVDAANRALAVIYRQLARGASAQQALSRARQALYVEEPDGASWYVPTLYVRATDEGPAYLIGPSPEQAAPASRSGASQVITASGKGSRVEGSVQRGGGSASQRIRAEGGGVISDAEQQARSGEQEIRAEDGGTIDGATQQDQ